MVEPLDPRPPWFQDHGLDLDPFSPDAPIGPVLFQSLREMLDLLQHLAVYGHQLVALLGPPGAGKHTLQSLLLERSEEQWSVVRLGGKDASDREGLLFELLQAWQVNVPVNASLAARELLLRDRLAALRQAGGVPLLLVSEAERLPEPALRLLCTLSRGEAAEGRLQVVLFADESLRERLEALEGDTAGEGFVHWLELPRMEDEEAFTLLQECWHQAGGGALPLDRERVAELNEIAGGLPGPLLREAGAELGGLAGEEREPRWHQGRQMAVGGALLVLMLLGLFLWLGRGEEDAPGVISQELELPTGQQAPAAGKVGQEGAAQETPPEPEISPPVVELSSATGEGTGALSPESPAPAPDAGAPTANEGLAESEDSPAPDATVARDAPDAVAGDVRVVADEKPGAREEPKSAPGERPVTPAPVAQASAPGEEKAAPGAKPGVSTAAPVEVPPAETAPVKPAPVHRPRTAAWLRGLDPDSYVIQVFGSHDRGAALRFIRRYKRQDHFAWFETRHRGRPWYVVVYGHYPDRRRARAALARLPASLRKERPWLRRVGEIQQALNG